MGVNSKLPPADQLAWLGVADLDFTSSHPGASSWISLIGSLALFICGHLNIKGQNLLVLGCQLMPWLLQELPACGRCYPGGLSRGFLKTTMLRIEGKKEGVVHGGGELCSLTWRRLCGHGFVCVCTCACVCRHVHACMCMVEAWQGKAGGSWESPSMSKRRRFFSSQDSKLSLRG